eukprot:6465713-Amphidinium_carterae.1
MIHPAGCHKGTQHGNLNHQRLQDGQKTAPPTEEIKLTHLNVSSFLAFFKTPQDTNYSAHASAKHYGSRSLKAARPLLEGLVGL